MTTTEEVMDQAYAEKAVREERDDQPRGRERLIDLAERAPLGAAPLDLGDDPGREHDPLAGEAEHDDDQTRSSVSAGARTYRGNPDVYNDIVGESHGFLVRSFSNPDRPEVCRYCGGRLLAPDDASVCEFADATGAPRRAQTRLTDVTEGVQVRYRSGRSAVPVKVLRRTERFSGSILHPGYDVTDQAVTMAQVLGKIRSEVPRPIPARRFDERRCGCSACMVARDGRRKRGGQEIACYNAACRQRLADDQRDQNRRTEAQRKAEKCALHRQYAVPLIRSDPTRSDRDIAKQLTEKIGHTVPIVRVREARDRLGESVGMNHK